MFSKLNSFLDKRIVFFILFIVGFALYFKSLTAPFLYDDFQSILTNPIIQNRYPLYVYFKNHIYSIIRLDYIIDPYIYRPLQSFMHSFIYSYFGSKNLPYHFIQIFLHCFNAYLLFLLAKKLELSNMAAFLPSLIFLVHPINSEAVIHSSYLGTPLSTFFLMIGLLLYFSLYNSTKPIQNIFKILFLSAFYFLALISKESAWVLLPLAFLSAIYYKIEFAIKIKKRYILTPLFIMGLVLAFYYYIKQHNVPFNPSMFAFIDPTYYNGIITRILTFVCDLTQYFKLFVFPLNLYHVKEFVLYKDLPMFYLSTGVALIILSVYFAARNKRYFYGISFFFISLIPFMGIFPMPSTYLESYAYLPFMGVLIALGTFFDNFRFKKALALILIFGTILLGIRTFYRIKDWNNEEIFSLKLLDKNTQANQARRALAEMYALRGEDIKAVRYYELLSINGGNDYMTLYQAAVLFFKHGDFFSAQKWLLKSLELNPDNGPALNLLQKIYLINNEPEKVEYINELFQKINTGAPLSPYDIEGLQYEIEQNEL